MFKQSVNRSRIKDTVNATSRLRRGIKLLWSSIKRKNEYTTEAINQGYLSNHFLKAMKSHIIRI